MNYNLIRRTPVYQKELRFILYNFRHTTADHLLIIINNILLASSFFTFTMSSKNNKTKNTLTLLEKREICILKQSKPTPTNKDLAIRFKIHENTVSNILKRKSENLNVNPEDSISHNKRLRHAKYPV